MKKMSIVVCAALIAGAVLSGCGKKSGVGIHHAEIDIKDYGVISVELDGDTAPITFRISWTLLTAVSMTILHSTESFRDL